jgi:uncharacterized protein (DUF362 family)
MKKLSRQEFLQLASLGLGAVALEPLLSACAKAVATELPKPQSSPTQVPTATTGVTRQVDPTDTEVVPNNTPEPGPTSPPAEAAYLAVARGSDDPETLVRRAISALGGMEKFVPKGARVMIKPNICVAYHSYEYAATTNPWVVAALVRLALEAGAKSVQVLDYPFGGSASEAYVRSGIQELVLAAGGEMAAVSGIKFVPVNLPNAQDLKKIKAFKDALDADVLIDVPIAKHHSLARLTLGMKNLMGLVQNRETIHQNLGQRIADLASLFQPDLTVVDAVRVLMANGPTGGNLDDVKKLDTVIASADIVAADSYATSLFDLQPADIAYIPAAAAMGIGRSDLENLKIEEIAAGS